MSWGRDRYSGYRGRSTVTQKLRVIAAVLAVLVALAVGLLLLGQRYIVYTDEGIRVEWPFLGEKGADSPSGSGEEIHVVIESD